MKANAMDLGVCGVEQLLHAGTITFETKASEGIVLVELPKNIIITKAAVVVNKAFNADSENKLSIGTDEGVKDLMTDSEVTAGTAGTYTKNLFVVCKGDAVAVKAKLVCSSSEATEGEADVYLGVVRIPE